MNKRRNYENEYPSVTTLISLLASYGLMEWFKRTPYNQILEESKKAKQIGEDLHKAICEHITLNEVKVETQYPDEIMNTLKSFMLFKSEHPEFKLKRSEIQMVDELHKINGTLDAISDDIVFDWKSAKCRNDIKPPIYPEALWQVSCYTVMYNEIFKTNIQKAIVVALAKDKIAYNYQEIGEKEIRDNFINIILPLRTIWQYKHKEQ